MASFIPNVDLTILKKFFGGVEGRGSFLVSDTISPILEIQDIALFQRRDTRQFSGAITTVGAIGHVSLTVDAGEFWLIHYLSVVTDILDADQAVTVQLYVRPPGVAFRARLLVPVVIGNSEQGGIGAAFGRPLIIPSGTVFGAASNAITVGGAGAITLEVVANISRVTT